MSGAPRPTARQEVQAVLDRITFGPALQAFRPGLELHERPKRGQPANAVLVMWFPERDTGEPYRLHTAFRVPADRDPRETARAVFAAAVARLQHEVGEAVRLDGALFADPHDPTSDFLR